MALGKNLTKKTDEAKPQQSDQQSVVAEVAEESRQEVPTPDEATTEQETFHQFCVFKSSNEEYAVPINLIKEVVRLPKVAPVSQMPAYIKGMTNVRGNIYGVLNLGLFFGTSDQTKENRFLLVLEHDTYQMAIAIPDVPDTLMVSDAMIEQLSTARLKSVIGQKYLKGIIKKDRRMIILFDILGVISSDQFTKTS